MPQIINEGPGIAALLGTGIGSGLQQLSKREASQNQMKQVAQGLQALGLSPQEALGVSSLPPKVQMEAIKALASRNQSEGSSPIDQALAGLGLGGSSNSSYQQAAPSQSAPMASAQNELASNQGEQGSQVPMGTQQQQLPKGRSFADILARPNLTEDQKIKIAALQQKDQHKVDKETFPYYSELNKKRSAARDALITLGRQEELNKGKGENLSTPVQTAIIDALGHGLFGLNVDLSGLTSADSQEFRKLSYSFLRFAKDYFGGRVTNYEAKAFMQSIPTLLQSAEGKQRIINNMRTFAEIDIIKAQAMDRLIEKNGGNRPKNLESLVDQEIEPQLQEIADRFKRGLAGSSTRVEKVPPASEVPKGTSYTDPKTGKKKISDGNEWKDA